MSSRSRVEGVRAESLLLYCALDAFPSLSLTSRSSCSIRIAGDSKWSLTIAMASRGWFLRARSTPRYIHSTRPLQKGLICGTPANAKLENKGVASRTI